MKLDFKNAQIQKSLHTLTIICCSILFFFFAKNFSFFLQKVNSFLNILGPFILGFLVAYVLIRPLNWIEQALETYLFHDKGKKAVKRSISILVVLFFAFLFLYLLSSFVLPQLLSSMNMLSKMLPDYINALEKLFNNTAASLGSENMSAITQSLLQRLSSISEQTLQAVIPFFINLSISLTSKVMNIILVFAVTIYVLFDKEKFSMQTKKILYALLPSSAVKQILSTTELIDDTFGRYINGQLTDAVVVGIMTSVLLTIFQLPYSLLIGVIVACTNVIPMVGPIIGAIPSIFIILMTGNLSQTLLFAVLILVIQQIDGNILVPRIVGNSTGLSGFWVLFAIFVSGGLFGITGIILCVPTLSVLFQLFKGFLEKRLSQKGLPIETTAYSHLIDEIPPEE